MNRHFNHRRWRARAALAAMSSAVIAIGATSTADAAVTQRFAPTGAEQTFTVPAGVSTLHIVAVGGKGGDVVAPRSVVRNGPGGSGGFGAVVSGDLAVTPGEVLDLYVAGNGANSANSAPAAGGYNGGGVGAPPNGNAGSSGGGGGGASDVRVGGSALSDRVLVAAGGGGAGAVGNSNSSTAGNGGAAGQSPAGSYGEPASPGTATSGGSDPGNGGSGGLGFGGAGATDCCYGGGGGGSGLYGGAGGSSIYGQPGAGGSSFTDASILNPATAADRSGSPSITLSYVGLTNTAPPTVSGFPYQSKTLTGTAGTWTGSSLSYVYQWQRCDAGGGSCVPSGPASAATSNTTAPPHVVSAADLGGRIRLQVTASDGGSDASAVSDATAVVSKYSQVILADGPIAYWRLGDAFDRSSLSDASPNGHVGEYKNGAAGTAGSPQPSYGVSGDGDTAAIFTGNGTYGFVSGMTAPQSAYTIETWIKPTNLSAQMIFEQGGAGALWIDNAGRLAFRQVDNFTDSEIDYALPAGFDLTTFHQVVATWDGRTATLYLDGAQVGRKPVADPVSGASTVYLGYGSQAPWFSGYMDEAAYYDKALSDSQVLTHYHADPPFNEPASAAGPGTVLHRTKRHTTRHVHHGAHGARTHGRH